MKILLRFWAVFGFTLTLFGIFWVPKDLEDWQQAAEPWKRWLAMVDQNTALWVFSFVALTYIFWIDIRPFYLRWRERSTKHPIEITEGIFVQTQTLGGTKINGKALYFNKFYLVVGNGKASGETLRKVQCRLFLFGEPALLGVKNTLETSVDIQHGAVALFEIGKIASFLSFGHFEFGEELGAEKLKSYEYNIPNGHLMFEVTEKNKSRYNLAYLPDRPNIWEILLVISADDELSKRIIVKVDMQKEKEIVWWENIQ